MSVIRPIQSGQTVWGMVKKANPGASNAEIATLTQQVLRDNNLSEADARKLQVGREINLTSAAREEAPSLPNPLQALANGASAVFEGAGKGLGSILEGAGRGLGNFLGGLGAPPQPPKPQLPLVTPENLFQMPTFPQRPGQPIFPQQQQQNPFVVGQPGAPGVDMVLNAQILAGLSPQAARQMVANGQFATPRHFNLSGQQFIPSADPNIILRNFNR